MRKADQKYYALKKIHFKQLNEKEKQNALNEVRILASVRNAHIISYKEVFVSEDNNHLW